MTNICANEIVARHHFPWDEIVLHLHELNHDGFILMTQLSTAVIRLQKKVLISLLPPDSLLLPDFYYYLLPQETAFHLLLRILPLQLCQRNMNPW